MSELDDRLKKIQSAIGCCTYHMQSEEFRDEIKQAFKDAGYVKLHEKGAYDAINEAMKAIQTPLMTGQEWLSKALHTIWKYQQDRDYFRDNKHFRASTITMDELEMLLQRASGIEVES